MDILKDRNASARQWRKTVRLGVLVAILVFAFGSVAGAQDTSSINQLTIAGTSLSDHCVPVAPGANFAAGARTLTIFGVNFKNGAQPIVRLGSVELPPVDTWEPTILTTAIECSQYRAGTYRLSVSTGSGTPYNDSFAFSLATQGPTGAAGLQGEQGQPGDQGPNGLPGLDGAPGQNGVNGQNGQHGQNGRGHRVQNTRLLPGQGGCNAGGTQLDFHDVAPDGTAILVDTRIICHGNNGAQGQQGNQGANGRDGAPGLNGLHGPQGPQGPAGVAKGWHKNFGSAGINSAGSKLLSQLVTGTNAYLIDAKLNAPFASGAKSVTCSLQAVENGATTVIDSVDALLVGNQQNTARGSLSLAGVYTASSASASVTISVTCQTGGDSRTLANGRLNIVGVDSLN